MTTMSTWDGGDNQLRWLDCRPVFESLVTRSTYAAPYLTHATCTDFAQQVRTKNESMEIEKLQNSKMKPKSKSSVQLSITRKTERANDGMGAPSAAVDLGEFKSEHAAGTVGIRYRDEHLNRGGNYCG